MANRYPESAFTENSDGFPTTSDLEACGSADDGWDPRELPPCEFQLILDGSPSTADCQSLRAAFAQRRTLNQDATKANVQQMLELIGEDPAREGLRETPRRVMESMQFLTDGYQQDVGAILRKALFTADADEMVIVRDTEFYSLCEHHMLPFFGRVHVGYLPDGKIVGLSKIPRVIDVFAHRLQVQERLTVQIAEALMTHLKPKGVAVVIEAQHLCMLMRGVQKYGSDTVTSAMLGTFKRDARTRNEFMEFIRRK
ncbi:MAG: GTP cyclohydrolase I FolE [bacterium]